MTHSEYLEKKREEIRDNENLNDEMLDFYRDLFLLEEKYTDIFCSISAGNITPNVSAFPVLKPENAAFTAEELSVLGNLLHDLTSLISGKNPGLNFEALNGYFSENEEHYAEILTILLEKDYERIARMGDDIKTGRDEFLFILINLFKPFLVSLRSKIADNIDFSDWLKPVCPFCGFEADMAKIVESKDNKRLLHCALCENEWDFRRIYCPVCSNDKPDTLGFLVAEDEIFRIDYCDECKGYIKTMRIQKQFEETRFDLLVENILTPELDAAAFEMGYRRP